MRLYVNLVVAKHLALYALSATVSPSAKYAECPPSRSSKPITGIIILSKKEECIYKWK
jgi:hypothetical protein